jgi:hypothetical protein
LRGQGPCLLQLPLQESELASHFLLHEASLPGDSRLRLKEKFLLAGCPFSPPPLPFTFERQPKLVRLLGEGGSQLGP